jgi:LiaF transmembrane domain
MMKPSSVWLAAVLLTAGVCGILDSTGVLPWSETVGQWWPLAIVGWAVADMATQGRLTFGGVICAGIGLTLLADVQAWASDALLWSAFALFAGSAVLIEAALKRNGSHAGDHEGDRARLVADGGSRS